MDSAPTPPTERVLQVGEGIFIRAFVDWLLQRLRAEGLFDGSVVLTPARAQGRPKIEALRAQDYLFTLWTRGIVDGNAVDETEVVSIISRAVNPFEDWESFLACAEQETIDIVVSNTTEMGIAYAAVPRPEQVAPASYAARLTAYLKRRFDHFDAAPDAGMVILPCELIERNGTTLRDIVLKHAEDWNLGEPFAQWVRRHNAFCDTLVDRIVPGRPDSTPAEVRARLGYEDDALVVAEPYHLWAITADPRAMQRLPFDRGTLNVRFTDDLGSYRIQKLRALNGTHTFMAALGLLLGLRTVRDAMTHPSLGPLVRDVFDGVIAPYSETDVAPLRRYAAAVFERFDNPFMEHLLRNITLNSIGKFRIRLLPVLLRYHEQQGSVPAALCLSLAATLLLYDPDSTHHVEDAPGVIDTVRRCWTSSPETSEAVHAILAHQELWGCDLTAVDGCAAQVTAFARRLHAGDVARCLSAVS